MLTRYLTEAPRRNPRAEGTNVDPSLADLSLKAGDPVYVYESSEPDSEGELFVYGNEARRGPMSYVDAAILSETPPAPAAPPAKAEVVEEEVVTKTTTKTIVLRLTEEEAETLRLVIGHGVAGTNTGRRRHTNAIYRALESAGVKRLSGSALAGTITLH
jgi:hypothetical protein